MRTHGKFLSRDGGKFLIKATRLPDLVGTLDLNEKLVLRRRLDELVGGNVNTLILTEGQAETVLGVAGQAGLRALIEIPIDPRGLIAPGNLQTAIARVTKTIGLLRGYPALMGFLLDCATEDCAMQSTGFDLLRNELAVLVRTIHESHGNELVGFERPADTPGSALSDTEHARRIGNRLPEKTISDLGEDLTYVKLPRVEAADLGAAVASLHRLAAARPLVIEFGEDIPGQVEMVAHAFGLGAAGIVVPAMRPVASSCWQRARIQGGEEDLLPFAQLGDSVPLPAATPMVSVVVLARDDEPTITACLESIGRLHYPNCEVIVFDDGSRDATANLAASIAGPRPIRIVRGRREGFGAACNAAMRLARGQFIAFTRADCIVDADWLAFGVRVILETGLDGCRGPIYPTAAAAGIATRAIASLARPITVESQDWAPLLVHRNMIVRTAALSAVGGFDERFVDGGGDADLAARMVEAKLTLDWSPAGFVWRCGSASVGEFYRRRIRHGRAQALLAIKHPGFFGTASRRSHQPLTSAAADGTPDGIVVRSLSVLFSLSGAIAQAVACRRSAGVVDRTSTSALGGEEEDRELARVLPIANNHPHSAQPALHR